MTTKHSGLAATFSDAWLVDGVRTPFADYNGALASVSPIDLGIKAAREVFANAPASPARTSAPSSPATWRRRASTPICCRVISGSIPACRSRRRRIMVQRVCGTGIEVLAQACRCGVARTRRSGALRRRRDR